MVVVRIADLPSSDRPRERLSDLGPSALSDRELLAVLLGMGGKGASALDVAGELLADRGSLAAVSRLRWEELTAIEHLGTAKAARLVAAFELGRRASREDNHRNWVRDPEDLVALVQPLLIGKPHEEVLVVVMNTANKVIRTVHLSKGGASSSLLTVRDVLSCVLRNDGVAFALAHNHPSGNAMPSPEDLLVTRQIEEGAKAAGLRLLDHIVVAGNDWHSARAEGSLELTLPEIPTYRSS